MSGLLLNAPAKLIFELKKCPPFLKVMTQWVKPFTRNEEMLQTCGGSKKKIIFSLHEKVSRKVYLLGDG